MNEDFNAEIDETPGDAEEQQPDPNAELSARLAKIEAENATLRRQMTASALAQPAAKLAPKAPPQLDLKGLPDPNDNRDAYDSELARRIDRHTQARLDAEREQQQVAAQQQERGQGIVQRFQETYPDIAKDPERMKIAADQAWTKGKARGLDMDRYIHVATDDFFAEVVSEHRRLFGEAKPAAKAEDEGSRTNGLFGGLEGVGRPTGGKSKEQLGSLTDDLKKTQRSMGISW